MNGMTIPLPDIVARLAGRVSCGEDTAGAFLHEFSVIVAQGLAADGFVRIDGLGVFKVTSDVEGNPTVEFAPDRGLAETVNEPFAIFEPVELADSLSDDELTVAAKDNYMEGAEDVAEVKEPTLSGTTEVLPPPIPPRFTGSPAKSSVVTSPAENTTSWNDQETAPDVSPHSVAPSIPTAGLTPTAYEAPLPVRLEPESRVTVRREGHSGLTLVFAAIAAGLLGLLIGLLVGYKAERPAGSGAENNIASADVEIIDETVQEAGSADAVVPDTVAESAVAEEVTSGQPAVSREALTPAVVTDTVAPGNYLSVMARRHYGNAKFWVYIYLENKDKIQNPDNLENGMVLVIPPASKYGIDPDSRESLRQADREAWKATQ